MPVKNRFAELLPEITAWRRDLHEHPGTACSTCTAPPRIVAEKLREFGCDEVVTGIGKTGVVGVIRGKRTSGRVVGLRADMDALPIHEADGGAVCLEDPGQDACLRA